jgi:hypothetical protein
MDVISPESVSNRIRSSDRAESFIALSSRSLNDAQFLAVMVPDAKPSDSDFPVRPEATRIDANGWLGANMTDNGVNYFAFFRTGAGTANSVQGFTTDALRFMAALENGKLSKAYFEGGSLEGYGANVKCSPTATVAVSIAEEETALEIKSGKPCQVSVSNVSKPAQVLVNGSVTKNWKYDAKAQFLTVSIPGGRTNITVK